MKIVAAAFADFEHSFLGGPSALQRDLGGQSIITHTLRRLAAIDAAAERLLVVRPRDEAAAREAVVSAGVAKRVSVAPIDDGARPRRELVRSARKWNLASWRGTPLGTTWFDEFVEPQAVGRVLDHTEAAAVLCLDGCMPMLDVAIARQMIAYQIENADEAKFVFTQAPPGIAGVILPREVTHDLFVSQSILGHVLTYRPEMPRMDLITRAPCCRVDAAIAQTPFRLVGDVDSSFQILKQAVNAIGPDLDASTLCHWIRATRDNASIGCELPIEIEIELTTRDPLSETTLRPRGSRMPLREMHDIVPLLRLAKELAARDDARIMLGGFGDPLLHPRFCEVVIGLRDAGVCAIGVTSPFVDVGDDAFAVLMDARVDAVEVLLDADSPENYRRVHGRDEFERVLANIERMQALRRERISPHPLIIPSLTRCAATAGELEAFYDRWIRTVGSAVLRGHSSFGGRVTADNLLGTTPPVRGSCRRLPQRLQLLADGRAVACDQDVDGTMVLGDWRDQRLIDIWRSREADRLRTAHRVMQLSEYSTCLNCDQWNRV